MIFNTVYIVDDNPITLFLHKDVVGDVLPSAEILSYNSSIEFVNSVASNPQSAKEPILILLDISMSGKNGYEVLDELQDQVENKENLNVIMVTSSNLKSDYVRSTHYDCVFGYMEKPISINSLKTALLGGY